MVVKQETIEEIIARVPQWSTLHWQDMEGVFDEEQDPPRRPEASPAGLWGDIDWNEMGLVNKRDEQVLSKLEREAENDGQEIHGRRE